MHVYQKEFLRLYDMQPDTLDHIAKLLRIDKLACIELTVNIELGLNPSLDWFFALQVLLTEMYIAADLDFFSFPSSLELVKIQAKQVASNQDQLESKATLDYLSTKHDLITYLKECSSNRSR